MNQVSDILNKLVPRKGKTKTEVANKLGISSQLLGQYLSGRHNPKPDFYAKWKEVFGEDLLNILERNVSREKSNQDDSGAQGGTNDPWKDKYIALMETHLNSMKQLEVIAKTNRAVAKTLLQQLIKVRVKIEKADEGKIQLEVNKSIDEQLEAAGKADNYF